MIDNDEKDLYDLLESDALDNARLSRDAFSVYNFEGRPVPRVTKIIDDVMNRDYLIRWAMSFRNYNVYLGQKDFITSIGTHVHEMIEHFLTTGEDKDISYKKAPRQAPLIDRAYNNFKAWYNNLVSNGYTFKVIDIEKPLFCPFYAGTCDCICNINGANYIIDFKTSKKISYEYLLQLAAYTWIINNGYTEYDFKIDGIGVIRVDKEKPVFEDLFLTSYNPNHNNLIKEYIDGFFSILKTYYYKIQLEYEFNRYHRQYKGLMALLDDILKVS